MNSKLREAQDARNMAKNKCQRFGKAYQDENRRHKNYVAKMQKTSLRIYFENNSKKTWWAILENNLHLHVWQKVQEFEIGWGWGVGYNSKWKWENY